MHFLMLLLKIALINVFFDAVFQNYSNSKCIFDAVLDWVPSLFLFPGWISFQNFIPRAISFSSPLYFLNLISFGHTNPNIIDYCCPHQHPWVLSPVMNLNNLWGVDLHYNHLCPSRLTQRQEWHVCFWFIILIHKIT